MNTPPQINTFTDRAKQDKHNTTLNKRANQFLLTISNSKAKSASILPSELSLAVNSKQMFIHSFITSSLIELSWVSTKLYLCWWKHIFLSLLLLCHLHVLWCSKAKKTVLYQSGNQSFEPQQPGCFRKASGDRGTQF